MKTARKVRQHLPGLATHPHYRKGRDVIMAQRRPNKNIPLDFALSMSTKILSKAKPVGSCLVRTTHLNGAGYTGVQGPVSQGKRSLYLAHRVVMVAALGEQIADNLTVDHVCENRACVNPRHLRVMPLAQNILRSKTNPAAVNARKTHCLNGHPFDAENTYFPRGGGRSCRACQRVRNAEYKARKRAA